MDPIAKAKMVALKGIKRVLAQDPMAVPPGINRFFFFTLICSVDFWGALRLILFDFNKQF